MIWSLLIKPIASLFGKALDIVDELVEDKDKANELKAALNMRFMEISSTELMTTLKSQTDIILAEAKGDSWLQRNWRPMLMLLCMVILLNNFIVAPYVLLFLPGKALILELPGWLGGLMIAGVGGYVGGRTVEKILGVTGNKTK